MGFIDRARKAYRVLTAKSDPEDTTDTRTNLRRMYRGYFPWMEETDTRKAVEEIISRMDDEDEIVSSALDAIAYCATTFIDAKEDREVIIESDDPRVNKILGDMVARTGIDNKMWDIVRTTVEKGNHFCRVVLDKDGLVSDIKQFPYSYQIVKNVDEGGNLLRGNPIVAMEKNLPGIAPYDQIIDHQLVASFYELQILHFMYGVTKGLTYAKPILRSAVRNWRRLQAGEDSVAVARIIRAYNQIVHHVPMPIEATQDERVEYLRRYKEMMTRQEVADWNTTGSYTDWASTPDPDSVFSDTYLPRLYTKSGDVIDGAVESIGGQNPHITNLEDLDRSLNRILCVLKVPAKYLNYDIGRHSFVDTGDSERDEQFGRVLRGVQKAVKRPLFDLCDLELALNGINPTTVEYSIIMPPIAIRAEERIANVENQRGQTATYWRAADVPAEMVWSKVLGFTPEEIKAAQDAAAANQQAFAAPGVDDDA